MSLRVFFSVNVIKPAVSCGFGHSYLRNPSWETSFLCNDRLGNWLTYRRLEVQKYLCLLYLLILPFLSVTQSQITDLVNIRPKYQFFSNCRRELSMIAGLEKSYLVYKCLFYRSEHAAKHPHKIWIFRISKWKRKLPIVI